MQKLYYKKIAIGVDRGFGATKYYSDIISGHIDSLVAPITEKRAVELFENNIDDENVIIIKIDNNYYLIGSYVAQVEPAYAERDLRRSRDSINETILFIAGMGLATGNVEEAELIVTTGLPTDDYERLKESYEKKIYNNGEPYVFSIFRKGKEYKKSLRVIKVNIENQPKGTIIATINQKLSEGMGWNELKSRRFAVCDIGFNTTDLSIYVGKDIVRGDKINFSTFAMVQITATAKKLIEDSFNCKKTEDEVLESLRTGKVKIRGQMRDCSEQVREAFLRNADLLVSEITSKWEVYLDSFDEMILTGGTLANSEFAAMLKSLFEEKCGWHVTIAENPQYANSFGFYLISASILQSMQKVN